MQDKCDSAVPRAIRWSPPAPTAQVIVGLLMGSSASDWSATSGKGPPASRFGVRATSTESERDLRCHEPGGRLAGREPGEPQHEADLAQSDPAESTPVRLRVRVVQEFGVGRVR
jgi:hypothetical protein